MSIVKAGSWVQIEQIILTPEERAPQIPAETKEKPFLLLAKGFLRQTAKLGETVSIETIAGRTLQGRLIALNPPYLHGFGAPIPELLRVGIQFRELLSGTPNSERKAEL